MRLSIHAGSFGEGIKAGSPTADHINCPKLSVKPAIGFQAAVGAASIPSVSQPFQGKSFSFTVRMNIDELRPVTELYEMFSMPAVNAVLKYSRFTV